MARGILVLVVGPSGAGKDTLLAAARAALADDPAWRFVRRAITRPADAGGEDHEALDEAAFRGRSAAGGFALEWGAHGLLYGIPADIADDLDAGRNVVANASRGVLADAAARFPVRVVEVTAPPEILARRLAARGREAEADILARLRRTVPDTGGPERIRVDNSGSPEAGAAAFLAALRGG